MFRIEPTFRIGPGHVGGVADVSLPALKLPRRFTDRVTTAEAIDREEALIAHYRGIVRLAEAHRKAATLRPFPYFRTQPEITAGDEALTEFAWNDDVSETRAILALLAGAADRGASLFHDDQDQEWRILIEATNEAVCLIEWNAGGDVPESGGYAFDPELLAEQASRALERLHLVHYRLVMALGSDYWN